MKKSRQGQQIPQRQKIQRGQKQTKRHRGFSLLEIMVVMVILVMLAGLSARYVLGTRARAQQQNAFTYIKVLSDAIDAYSVDIGYPPTTEQGLAALATAPSDLENPDAWTGYIKSSASSSDPWGMDYQYACPGKNGDFDVWSFGPDRQDGTDDDIGNWMSGI